MAIPTRQSAPSEKSSLEEVQSPSYEHSASASWTVFDDPVLAKHYMPPTTYESYHRFDPTLTWSPEEEKKLIRKLDFRIAFFVCICFVALQLDRGNIVQALSDGMLQDLGLTSADYNLGQTIFYVSFLFAELPSQLISKKLGVDRWVPLQICLWSIVAISQCRLNGKASFFVTRSLIGLIEGGFIPDILLYLSYYYKKDELPIRLSFFWITLTSTTIVGSFLAAGILRMRGLHGWGGWRYLFLIEGLVTLAIGIFAGFWFPASPTQTRGGIRGKNGWFSEREEYILVTRVLKDDHTKSDMHNRQHISIRQLFRSFGDYDHWPLYILGLTTYIAPAAINAYFTLILRSLGFSTFHTNLLTIPANILFIINNFGLASLSKKVKERTFVASLGSWWQFILLIPIVALPTAGPWVKYTLLTLLLGYPYAHPILVSWNSNNSGSVATRSVSASLYNMSVQLGSIIASNIFQVKDKPLYKHGNRVLLAIVSTNLVLYGLTKVYFIKRNQQKSKAWEALTPEEQDNYLTTTTDKGNRRLDFRFEH